MRQDDDGQRGPGLGWALELSLRRRQDGPEIAREPVGKSDLAEFESQTWFDAALRGGEAAWTPEDVPLRLEPVFRSGSTASCDAFALVAKLPDGRSVRRVFDLESLTDVAVRAIFRLREAGALGKDERVFYRIRARFERPTAERFEVDLTVSAPRRRPLVLHPLPLAALERGRRSVGSGPEGAYPVFYTEESLARAERYARRGAERTAPVETGAVLLGPLCRCPETREVFAVACDVIEVAAAEETAFTLAYSGESWGRIQAVLRSMQADPRRRAWRLLGQAHGHNFLPAGGAPPCEACASLPVCGRSTVFVSESDRAWMRAVFARQPWQLCHIFGLNARKENVSGLFGVHGGRLVERGYHVVPGFDPSAEKGPAITAEKTPAEMTDGKELSRWPA